MALILKYLNPALRGVPEIVAVPFWLLLKMRPLGRIPSREIDGVGAPLVVMVNEKGAPLVAEMELELVMARTSAPT